MVIILAILVGLLFILLGILAGRVDAGNRISEADTVFRSSMAERVAQLELEISEHKARLAALEETDKDFYEKLCLFGLVGEWGVPPVEA